jgi:HK97 family phage major capsid protein
MSAVLHDGDLARIGLAMLDAREQGFELGYAIERRYGRDHNRRDLVTLMAKSAVASGTTQSGGWGDKLDGPRLVAADFAAATRALSLIGKLSAIRIPQFVTVPFIGARSRFGFVGEAAKIPAAKPTFLANVMLGPRKVAGIAVVSKELAKASEAEAVLARLMVDGVVEGLDAALTDSGTQSSTRPASLVSLAHEVYSGAGLADVPDIDNLLSTMISDFLSTGATLRRAAWLTSSTIAIGLAQMRDAGGITYPNVTVTGGTLFGLPMFASDYATPGVILLVDADALAVADQNVARISVSENALVYQSDDGTTHPVSIFATDSLALKVVREVDWSLAGSRAVAATGVSLPAGTWETA